ncbi:MAG TPA: hypothetical protein VNL18_03865 [Gemmatimonadales bacterium]|nr:hypothetical protein [Gemmatimonadales bacterium]
MRDAWKVAGPLVPWLLMVGCEPATITEAHDQLARGPARQLEYAIPITQDTFTVAEFLGDDTTTTADGLLAVTIAPETLGVALGRRLRFDNLAFARLKVNVPAGIPPGNANVNANYAALSNEARILAVDTVVVDSGGITITTMNRLPGVLTYTLTLNGFRDSNNVVVSRSGLTVPAAPGNGTYTSASVTINLRRVKIIPNSVNVNVSGTVNLTTTTTATTADSSIIQSGTGTIVVERLSGTLNPAATPELVIAVEESDEIPASSVDFGQLEDPVKNSTLNDVRLNLTVRNTSGAAFVLSNFTLGVVKLTAGGAIPRDGSNRPAYETDGSGQITMPVTDPGLTTLTIGKGQTKSLSLQSARLIDRVVDLVLSNQRAAVVGEGTVRVGDGTQSTISRADSVSLAMGLTVALDFTVPPAGVAFDTVANGDGMGLDSTKANDLAGTLDSAAARLIVTNGMPFGVEVLVAAVPDTLRAGARADTVFSRSNRVEIGPAQLGPAAVDAQGRVTAAVLDTVNVRLTGQQARVFFGEYFGSGTRIRLLPATGNRGAIRTTDRVILSARAIVWVRVGGR